MLKRAFSEDQPTLLLGASLLAAALASVAACGGAPHPAESPRPATTAPTAEAAPTVEDARAFLRRVDQDLRRLWTARERMGFVAMTYITEDTEALAAKAEEAVMEYLAATVKEAERFHALALPEDLARQLTLLRLATVLPAPSDPAEREELAQLGVSMTSTYGKGKYCPPSGECQNLEQLTNTLAKSRDWDKQLEAWLGWHSISPPMRARYQRFVALGNKGAQEQGFRDLGDLWRSGYDMTPDAFEAETDRLWTQVKPLYDELHCFVRARLRERYGKERIGERAPIPAHILGNMWAQSWQNLYPLLEPHKGQPSLDVTRALVAQKYDAVRMVKVAERFFTSLGLDPLPETFWKRSMLTKPRDREVVCHASAWDPTYSDDLRIKMCIEPEEEDLVVIHHELGHNYYYHYYYKLPMLFQSGAHDGFHEGIGDTLTLSITPGYLKSIGLLEQAPENPKAELNFLMKMALDRVAFLPFGKLIDQWRWDVFSGKTPPSRYNSSWWELRKKYQGIAPAVARTEDAFDAGAKYHVPGNTPYMRYFLARILQFQFHRALCRAVGHAGPLHTCSIHGRKEAGDKLRAMLSMGASRPWPEALYALSGERQMDATALLDYFAPLRTWLAEQNKGEACGW